MVTDFSQKYAIIIQTLKQKIRQAQLQAALTLNGQMLSIYWEIGKTIYEQENSEGWGTKVVDSLAHDLKMEFPEMRGFSSRNLRYMRDFAIAYPHFTILQTPSAKLENKIMQGQNNEIEILQIAPAKLENTLIQGNEMMQAELAKLSWHHHTTLLDKVKDINERQFYIQQTISNGWSRNVMVHQIEGGLYNRQGKVVSNFEQTIPPDQSELVQQIFKDPYKFDFIYLGKEAKERDLEDALTSQVTKFLIELGQWFAFMGRQHKMLLGEKEYFIDLLFYHTRLKRYIVIDLKMDEFEPEFKGKMEFYLNLADDQLKSKGDEPSIGLILCKTKNGMVAEYALRDSNKPIGIAEYKINENLPEDIKGELPTIEELEIELEKEYEELKTPAQKKFTALKEKLTNLKGHNEVRHKVDAAVIQELYKKSLAPLFDALLVRLHELDEHFYSATPEYQGLLASFVVKEEIAKEWKDEDFVDRHMETYFRYKLDGYKNAGVESFNIWLQITLYISNYWYGFAQMGYNNQQPFLKKMYHEQLTNKDVQTITDVAIEYVSDEIERQLSHIQENSLKINERK
jgi:predicted nuclease of restriction endonuclease-like (RecB) superfamily